LAERAEASAAAAEETAAREVVLAALEEVQAKATEAACAAEAREACLLRTVADAEAMQQAGAQETDAAMQVLHRARLSEVRAEADVLARERDTCRAAAETAEAEAIRLEAVAEAAGREAAEREEALQAELMEARDKVAALQDQLVRLQGEVEGGAELHVELASLLAAVAAGDRTVTVLREERDAAVARAVALEGELMAATHERDAAEATARDLKEEVRRLEADVAAAALRLLETPPGDEPSLETLEQNTSLAASLEEAKEAAARQDATLRDVRLKATNAIQTKASLLRKETERVRALEKDLMNAANANATLQKQVKGRIIWCLIILHDRERPISPSCPAR
jgi:hypothetical protein